MDHVVVDASVVRSRIGRLRRGPRFITIGAALASLMAASAPEAAAASPCDTATHPGQCAWLEQSTLPPFVHDAIVSKGGVVGAGNVLVLTSGDPLDPDSEICTDLGQLGCGTNPDGWETYDCVLMDAFVPPQDSVVLALSSEWFEWYQTIFTDWMTIAGAGQPTVDVSINSWISQKVDIIPYGPMDTGVVILTSLAASKMVNFRVADSGDHIYDTAIVVVPATWFGTPATTPDDVPVLCGNGTLEPGEECDDGNNDDNDGCSWVCLGAQPPSPPVPPATCGTLVYAWPNGATAPYTCGNDACAGYRCVIANTISPACYTADQCAPACAGACVDIQTAALDCATMCSVQPPTPPVVPPQACDNLTYAWPDGTSMPYSCDDPCVGQRCVVGSTIGTTCYQAGACDGATCPDGACVDVPADDCTALCALGEAEATCLPAQQDEIRPAANQKGECFGNVEMCNGAVWEIADGSWQPIEEACNGLDDDCNGVTDDMFVTCGDPGLCQNTVNTCDPANPDVPVPCVTLPPPSPVEICNDGLDNDCDGSADDGCECGDDECMKGETYEGCPHDCLIPPDDGTPCDDNDVCTVGDEYWGGICSGYECDGGNACVIGGCDPQTGCYADKIDCNDFKPCTVDSCDPASGCIHLAPPEVCNGADDDCDGWTDEGFDAGVACTSPQNDCGQSAEGTLICTADGAGTVCSAETPPNPAGYGTACASAPNACGDTAQGTVQCDGACSAVPPVAVDTDGDGVPDCNDACPLDPTKVAAGVCGCGVADSDTNNNGIIDCEETVRADLAASIELATKRPRAGARLAIALSATNLGPDRVPSVTFHAKVEGQFGSLKLPAGCSGTADAIVCTHGRVAAGRVGAMTISVVPAAGTTISVTESVSSPVYDPDPTNQSAALSVTVP